MSRAGPIADEFAVRDALGWRSEPRRLAKGLRGTGISAEPLSAERDTQCFAVKGGIFFKPLRAMVLEDLEIADRIRQ
jgi:hypothetical protein